MDTSDIPLSHEMSVQVRALTSLPSQDKPSPVIMMAAKTRAGRASVLLTHGTMFRPALLGKADGLIVAKSKKRRAIERSGAVFTSSRGGACFHRQELLPAIPAQSVRAISLPCECGFSPRTGQPHLFDCPRHDAARAANPRFDFDDRAGRPRPIKRLHAVQPRTRVAGHCCLSKAAAAGGVRDRVFQLPRVCCGIEMLTQTKTRHPVLSMDMVLEYHHVHSREFRAHYR